MSNLQDRLKNAKSDVNIGASAAPAPDYSGDPGWLEPDSLYHRGGHAAKLFCIASAFVIPNLLVIYVLL